MNKIIEKWEKLTYKSGFESIGKAVHGGWEHTRPINPDINDEIIKRETVSKTGFNPNILDKIEQSAS